MFLVRARFPNERILLQFGISLEHGEGTGERGSFPLLYTVSLLERLIIIAYKIEGVCLYGRIIVISVLGTIFLNTFQSDVLFLPGYDR